MSKIFISYAREDRAIAEKLAQVLEAESWDVFWDRDIASGKDWRDVLVENLAAAECVIVLWSKASVASDFVRDEADIGRQRKILFPAFIESEVLPPIGFRGIQTTDLTEWTGSPEDARLRKLILDISKSLPSVASEPAQQQAESRRIQALLAQREQFRRRYTLAGLTAGGAFGAAIGLFVLRAVLNLAVMDLDGAAFSTAFGFSVSAGMLAAALSFGISLGDQAWKAGNERNPNRWSWIRRLRYRAVVVIMLGILFFAGAHTIIVAINSVSESRTELFNSIPAAIVAGAALSIALHDQPYAGWRLHLFSWLWRLTLVAAAFVAAELPFAFKLFKGTGLTLAAAYEFYRDSFRFLHSLPPGRTTISSLAVADAALVGIVMFVGVTLGIAKAADLLNRWLRLIRLDEE